MLMGSLNSLATGPGMIYNFKEEKKKTAHHFGSSLTLFPLNEYIGVPWLNGPPAPLSRSFHELNRTSSC